MSIMDRRLRRAPDAEWVLMFRLGLSRTRIDRLVRVHPAVVGYVASRSTSAEVDIGRMFLHWQGRINSLDDPVKWLPA
jgi:hypothetical protein